MTTLSDDSPHYHDGLLYGYRTVQDDGDDMPEQTVLDFVGFTVQNDSANNRTKVSAGGGGYLPALGAALTVLAVNAGGSAAEWTSSLDVTSVTTDTATIGDPLTFDDGTESPSTYGRVRFAHNFGGVYARNQLDTGNVVLARWFGADQFILGGSAGVQDFDIRSASTIDLEVAGSSVLGCTSSLITAAQPLAIGTGTVSTSADINGDSSFHLAARNTGDTADSDLLLWLSDTLYVGHQTNVDDLALYAADGITFKVTGDVAYFVSDEFQLNDGVNLRVGWTNAAGTGDIRMQDTASIKAWATPGDCNLLSKDASDVITVADAANCSDLTLDSATTVHADIAGTPVLTCTASLISAAQDFTLADGKKLNFGTTGCATTGDQNVRSNWSLYGKDSTASGDVSVLKWTSTNRVVIGDNNALQSHIYLNAPTGANITSFIAGSAVLTVAASLITAAQDIAFDAGLASPNLYQATTTGDGSTFTLRAQHTTTSANSGGDMLVAAGNGGATGTGGDTIIRPGGGSTNGDIYVGDDTNRPVNAWIDASTQIVFANAGAWKMGIYSGSVTLNTNSLRFSPGVNAPTIYQQNTTGSAGQDLTIAAQGTTDANAAGDLILQSGNSSSGTDGDIYLQAAAATVLTVTSSLISAAQDFQVAAGKDVDCYTNAGYLKPRWVEQATIPTPDTAELLLWSDTTGGSTKLVYNCPTNGVVSTNLT